MKTPFDFIVIDLSTPQRKHFQALSRFPNGYSISTVWGCGTYSYPKCCLSVPGLCPDKCNEVTANFERYHHLECAVFDPNGKLVPIFDPYNDGSLEVAASLDRSAILELQRHVGEL